MSASRQIGAVSWGERDDDFMRRLLIGFVLVVAGCGASGVGASGGSSSPSTVATVATTALSTTPSSATASTVAVVTTVAANVLGSPVAWLDQPSAPNQRFGYTLPASVASAAPCALNALHVQVAGNGAMGTIYAELSVHNISSTVCQVQGVPVVELINNAAVVVARTDPTRVAADTSPPVVLEPDSWAQANLGNVASNMCTGIQSSQLQLSLGGGVTTMPFEVGPYGNLEPAPCPTDAPPPRKLGGDAFMAIPASGFSNAFFLMRGLRAQLEAPATVRAGDTLRYSVLLVSATTVQPNGTNSNFIDSEQCPVYRERLATTSAQYLLNCTNSIEIPIGSAVRFEMELAVPATTPQGPTTLTWETTEPTGITATAMITVTR